MEECWKRRHCRRDSTNKRGLSGLEETERVGRRSFEQLTNHLFPRLGTELYLYIESGDIAGLYDTDIPPPEYVATAFAARALHLKGEVLKTRVGGLPGTLLSLFSDKLTVSGRAVEYHIATAPKKIELSGDGTYYDWETGVGVVVY